MLETEPVRSSTLMILFSICQSIDLIMGLFIQGNMASMATQARVRPKATIFIFRLILLLDNLLSLIKTIFLHVSLSSSLSSKSSNPIL